jgi:hypothetical protein
MNNPYQGWSNQAQGTQVLIQTFTTSGTYQPSPGLVTAVVECIGGGAPGWAVSNPSATYILTGGGGGSGGYSRKACAGSLVLGGVVVTIGAGGLSSNEGNGAATSFGALCVANGGLGGTANDSTTQWGEGGPGASAGVGDVTFPGASGFSGVVQVLAAPMTLTVAGGMGGQLFGGSYAGAHTVGNTPGSNGLPNTGAGGSGAISNQTLTGAPIILGGNGGSGLCIVTEYCLATTGSGGSGCVNVPACPPGQWGWDG